MHKKASKFSHKGLLTRLLLRIRLIVKMADLTLIRFTAYVETRNRIITKSRNMIIGECLDPTDRVV